MDECVIPALVPRLQDRFLDVIAATLFRRIALKEGFCIQVTNASRKRLPVFQEENQSTIRDTSELISAMANLQSRFENLAEQLRRAEDERRGERRNR
jgi:hypothetical protein